MTEDQVQLEQEIDDAMQELSDEENELYRMEDEGLEGTEDYAEQERLCYDATNRLAYLESLRTDYQP